MKTSIELAEWLLEHDYSQVANFMRMGGNTTIAKALGRIQCRDRAYLRLIVGLQDDDETRNRWFDVLDEAEAHIEQLRQHIINNRVAGINDSAEWSETYNRLYPDFLSASNRVWGQTMFILGAQIGAWLESL